MADDARSAQEVLKDHLRQGQSGSIEADLDRNYAEDVVVLSRHVQRIDGGKHFTPEDHPDVIADALNDLLAEVRKW